MLRSDPLLIIFGFDFVLAVRMIVVGPFDLRISEAGKRRIHHHLNVGSLIVSDVWPGCVDPDSGVSGLPIAPIVDRKVAEVSVCNLHGNTLANPVGTMQKLTISTREA